MPISLSGSRRKLKLKLGFLATSLVLLVGCVASASAAKGPTHEIGSTPVPKAAANVENEASQQVSAALAVCRGQTFAQPFEALGDSNYYTQAPGSEFATGPEGWELLNGAQVVEGTRPDGSTGNVLDLPGGAVAVSPPVCVTLQYPTARTYAESVSGNGVSIAVAYGLGKGLIKNVGQIKSKAETGWELSAPFDVQPQTTGKEEGTREVRFVYSSNKNSEEHLFGLFVDPRFSH